MIPNAIQFKFSRSEINALETFMSNNLMLNQDWSKLNNLNKKVVLIIMQCQYVKLYKRVRLKMFSRKERVSILIPPEECAVFYYVFSETFFLTDDYTRAIIQNMVNTIHQKFI